MASITRDQFIASFQGQGIDVENLSPELQEQLDAAGIDEAKLRQMAGSDGVIRGDAELGKLFLAVDTLDRDGSYRSIATTDSHGQSTRAGGLITELKAEVENSRLRTPVGRTAPAAPKDAQPATQAPWLDIARGEVGQQEVAGRGHNPRILEYHGATKLKATSDETPWCSSFVNWTMKQAGYEGTNSASALSWKKWGEKSDEPVVGSIAVIDRGNGKGHVGIVVGRDGDNIILLGGNQKDGVRYSSYPASKISQYRVPEGYAPPTAKLPEVTLKELPLTFEQTR